MPRHPSGRTRLLAGEQFEQAVGCVSSAKRSLWFRSDSAANCALRGKRACSYPASAASVSPGWAAMALASSEPSNMARLAPSPANGDIRWGASPRMVTPATQSHRGLTGRALTARRTEVVSLSVMSAVSSGARFSRSGPWPVRERGPVRGRPCKADGPSHRFRGLIPVRYASVVPRIQRHPPVQGGTLRHRREQPASQENPASGHIRSVWQVMGSNHRRRSRRFYSPLAPPGPPAKPKASTSAGSPALAPAKPSPPSPTTPGCNHPWPPSSTPTPAPAANATPTPPASSPAPGSASSGPAGTPAPPTTPQSTKPASSGLDLGD